MGITAASASASASASGGGGGGSDVSTKESPLSLRINSLQPTQEIVTLHPKKLAQQQQPSTLSTNTPHQPTCCVCSIHPSQYTCPRCHIPYCSVTCYHKHDKQSMSTSDDINGHGGGGSCTENFYEHRVSQILQLEVKEQSGQFMKDITRLKQQQQQQEYLPISTVRPSSSCGDTNNDRDDTSTCDCTMTTTPTMNRDELLQLWSILEQYENETTPTTTLYDDDEISVLNRIIQQKCSVRTRTIVQQAVRDLTRGIISNQNDEDDNEHKTQATKYSSSVTDWILEPWLPWWRPHLVPFQRHHYQSGIIESDDDEYSDMDNTNNHHGNSPSSNDDSPTLDERLLLVPSFNLLHRRKEIPPLQYNLIDILFATVHTLRLYYGITNIVQQQQSDKHDDIVIDAAMTLTSSSFVLMQDQRYTTIEAVLMECCNRDHHPIYKQTIQYGTSNDSSSKNDVAYLLLQDVSLLFQNHRYVVRALLEASDTLQHAISQLKGRTPPTGTRNDATTNYRTKELRDQLRKLQKKIQFYISWTIAIASNTSSKNQKQNGWIYRHISTDIQVWIDTWQLPTIGSNNEQSSIKMITG